jgi:hypothetical protein
MVGLLSVSVERAAAAPTVTVADCGLLPLSVALIVVEPSATAVIEIAALVAPAPIVTGVCTVATAGLLLDNATETPVGAAAVRVTVPCTVLPAGTVVELNEIPARAVVTVGAVGVDDEPHAAKLPAKARMAICLMAGWMRGLVSIGRLHGCESSDVSDSCFYRIDIDRPARRSGRAICGPRSRNGSKMTTTREKRDDERRIE